ncbi:lipase family protein [Sorangium sp. So ce693]|uniref:lipase family protein n=1 Tax=Sorangium sp. So ce693 TaxID=3133318 RepID=UPI003F60334A
MLEHATSPEEHDSDATYLLAAVSAWAYARDSFAKAIVRKFQHNFHVESFRITNDALRVDGNAHLIRSDNGKLAILCFQGAEWRTLLEWTFNTSVNASMVQFMGIGRVNDVFFRNVDVIRPAFREALARALGVPLEPEGGIAESPCCNPIEKLYITGHGIGGGMAAVATAMLWNDPDERLRAAIRHTFHGVYTFGQPMVGDGTFATSCQKQFGSRVFRHEYTGDIIPSLRPFLLKGDSALQRMSSMFSVDLLVPFGKKYRCGDQGWLLEASVASPVGRLWALSMILPVVSLVYPMMAVGGLAIWGEQLLLLIVRGNITLFLLPHSPINYLRCSGLHRASESLVG